MHWARNQKAGPENFSLRKMEVDKVRNLTNQTLDKISSTLPHLSEVSQ